MCCRAEYGYSLNAMTRLLHATVSCGEMGTLDKKRSYDYDVEMRTSGLQLYTGGRETTL
jgi:hypothetical protein